VLLITHWYIGRYTNWFDPFDFKMYFIVFGILGVVVIGQGIVKYFLENKKKVVSV
jgi:hypothetical protein